MLLSMGHSDLFGLQDWQLVIDQNQATHAKVYDDRENVECQTTLNQRTRNKYFSVAEFPFTYDQAYSALLALIIIVMYILCMEQTQSFRVVW